MQPAPEKTSLTDRLRHLWSEGLTRHVVVAQGDHRVLDLPLTIVVVATVLAPWLVGVGALLALLTAHHIGLERRGNDAPAPASPDAGAPIDGAQD
ncbi:MAG: DUF4342 domain-containing protein [Gemmataceae bacterium]|nr:DUF4342 domain-containing protein [Gemmataceae bacterium]